MKMQKSVIFVKKNLEKNIWKIKNIVKLQIMLKIAILFSVCLCTIQQDHHYQSYQECQVLQNNWEKTSITFGCDQELSHTSLQSYTNHEKISLYIAFLEQFFSHIVSVISLLETNILIYFSSSFTYFLDLALKKEQILKQIAPP